MLNVSNKFKEAIYSPIRSCKSRVTFDISDTTADGDISSIETTPEALISNKQQLINKKRQQSYNLATCEPNRFRLDGSFSFADSVIPNNGELGFCSNNLCEESGMFTNYPTLTFMFNSEHSSMGITITFDALNNEYATNFIVTAYDGSNNVIDTVEIVDNDQVQSTPLGQLYKYKKLEVIIKKWCNPYRRARVCEVDFGVVRVYEDDGLIKMSLIEQLDLATGTVPSSEFKFTINNANREFNILNPTGFYKFLQQRQQVIAELGVEIGGTTEYVQLGNYLLWGWTSDEGSLTASFTARTNLDLMNDFDYENLVAKSDYNLYQMAIDIFSICGISNYQIDEALKNISTNGLVKKSNCKNILQMIAMAGCANIYVTRDNTIVIRMSYTNLDIAVDRIDLDNMYREPQIVLDNIIKAVEVSYYSNLNTKQIARVDNVGITSGEVLKLDNNTLINTVEQATNVANWLLKQKSYRAIYTANWRGNPAQELNDVITIEDGYGQNKNAIITKNEINYQGYLSAKTEAKGVI